jgi:hypothetical protein
MTDFVAVDFRDIITMSKFRQVLMNFYLMCLANILSGNAGSDYMYVFKKKFLLKRLLNNRYLKNLNLNHAKKKIK